MKTILVAFVLTNFCMFSWAQNLVPNSGMEENIECPVGFAGGFGPLQCLPWYNPSAASSDYLHACAEYPVNVPQNIFGNMSAHSGQAYLGSLYYYEGLPDYREYIQVQLTEPLIAGSHYQVTMYYAFGDLTCASNRMGIHFSADPLLDPSSLELFPGNPVPQLVADVDLAEEGWQQLSQCYVALGGEKWITIGSFDPDSLVAFETDCPLWGEMRVSYAFIDDVSVVLSESDGISHFSLGDDLILCDSSIVVELPDYYDAQWYDSSQEHSREISLPGIYAVTITDACGNTASDEIEILPATMGAPLAEFDVLVNDTMVSFVNTSQNAISVLWNFGDGTYSTEWEPVHIYDSLATYNVVLTVYGECTTDEENLIFLAGPSETHGSYSEKQLVVYPQPSNGSFRIEPLAYDPMIRAFDLFGNEVPVSRLNAEEFQIPDPCGGIYLISASFPEGLMIGRLLMAK